MASRKDIEAGRAHVLIYIKNEVRRGLVAVAANLKQAASAIKQAVEPLNNIGNLLMKSGTTLLAPLVAAVTTLEEAKQPLADIKKALQEGLGRPLLPVLMQVRDIVVRFGEWAKANPQIIRQVAMIGAGLIAAGIGVRIIAGGIMALASTLSIASVAASALAFFLSPAGLIVAGIALVIASISAASIAWVKFTDSGKRAFAGIMAFAKPFFETIRSAFSGIVDAFSAGRLELAWKITITSMKLLFFQMVQSVMDKFIDLVEFIVDNDFVRFVLGDALSGIAAGARGAGNATIAKIKRDLDALNRAAAAAAKAGRGIGAAPAEAAVFSPSAQHPSQVAQTTHQALALTFGNDPRNQLGLTKAQLEELKLIRKLSITQHKDMIAALRRGGTLRFTK